MNTRHALRITAISAALALAMTATDAKAQPGADPATTTATTPIGFDFRGVAAAGADGWRAEHDIANLEPTADGLVVHIAGPDPYLVGPPRDFPPGVPLLLRVEMTAGLGGTGQVFWSVGRQGFSEARAVRFGVRAGGPTVAVVPLPPLGPRTRFRIDPPGSSGTVTLVAMAAAPRQVVALPEWSKPGRARLSANEPDSHIPITSGQMVLRHEKGRDGAFAITVDGVEMASGWSSARIGYLAPGTNAPRWLDLADAATTTSLEGRALIVASSLVDPDGATWRLVRRFEPGPPSPAGDAIAVRATLTVDRDRGLVFAPLVTVLPGLGTFGPRKGQGLLAGVEYLDDEPSSSEADLEGPEALRRVPHTRKLTFPLMAIQAEGRYIGLTWGLDANTSENISALFDSPDRVFGSDAHILGLIAPGATDSIRVDGEILPFAPAEMTAGRPIVASATILGGRGDDIIPAVRHYVNIKGLPPLPETLDLPAYARLAAAGWLDSPIRDDDRFRHAVGGSFAAHTAADAPAMLLWLDSLNVLDPETARRARDVAGSASLRVKQEGAWLAAVGHLRPPVAPLVLDGALPAAPRQARDRARMFLDRLGPDGIFKYNTPRSGPDYGRTMPGREASGLAGQLAFSALDLAVLSGDRATIDRAVEAVRTLDRRFAHAVPRGAQTWEIALHTPDILASAHLAGANARAFELTGDPAFLDAARYWAWTGVPFVYLVDPFPSQGQGQGVGPYATIPVLGSTNWVAPVWIGLPVQWCGLVYADALDRLARIDPDGPWRTLVSGIARSGIQQTYPIDHDRRGLLPDSFTLATRTRNPADINPATLQPLAIPALGGPRCDDFACLRDGDLLVFAPGAIGAIEDTPARVSFTVAAWSREPSAILIHGLKTRPRAVRVDGQESALAGYLPDTGTAIIRIPGPGRAGIGVGVGVAIDR